ncbi:ribonuclease H-like domain-containing protein [Thiocapsa sp.]|uniref:ribonuclease H-like domain-containing protein n=1 Tax=Thiocapsa sp. TaxID=2024551 RepID=UPI0035948C1B
MTFRDRLQRLRGQAPNRPEGGIDAAASIDHPSLADRLRRVSVGRDRPPSVQEPHVATLAEAVGAIEIAPGVLCLERRFIGHRRHGQVSLDPCRESCVDALIDRGWVTAVSHLAPRPESEPVASSPTVTDLVCLDTETSGLAGGTGTWAFMTGLLRARGDGWTLRQYLLSRLDGEPAYLEAIAAELTSAGLLVSYNGLSFDIPLLTTRFRLSGQANPLPALPHLDLLKPVRRAYGRIWPDCRLASVEQRLLGFKRKDDLPGSEAPAAWLAWLRAGEVTPLTGVLRHNRWDLLSLAALIPRLGEVVADPGAFDADVRAVAAHHQAQGRSDQAFELLKSERRRLDAAGLMDLARLHRRRGDWDQARAIWDQLAAAGDAEARTELAKYHEHRTRDLRRALALARELPPGPLKERRCARLNAKLDARDGGSSGLLDTLAATLDGSCSLDRPSEH